MGQRSDPTAVVDEELRVHGLNGIRVIDASIMPTQQVKDKFTNYYDC